jgi:hypothetical protein
MTEFAGFQRGSPKLEIPLVLLWSLPVVILRFWACGEACCEVCRTILDDDKGSGEDGDVMKIVIKVTVMKIVRKFLMKAVIDVVMRQ